MGPHNNKIGGKNNEVRSATYIGSDSLASSRSHMISYSFTIRTAFWPASMVIRLFQMSHMMSFLSDMPKSNPVDIAQKPYKSTPANNFT